MLLDKQFDKISKLSYAVINTTDYNQDGRASIIVSGFYELSELGFNGEDVGIIKNLPVSGIYADTSFPGVVVVRLA